MPPQLQVMHLGDQKLPEWSDGFGTSDAISFSYLACYVTASSSAESAVPGCLVLVGTDTSAKMMTSAPHCCGSFQLVGASLTRRAGPFTLVSGPIHHTCFFRLYGVGQSDTILKSTARPSNLNGSPLR